jgi:hypothetical protein
MKNIFDWTIEILSLLLERWDASQTVANYFRCGGSDFG